MARISPQQVMDIMDTHLSIKDLPPFILAANIMVDEHIVTDNPSISTSLLREIERWLAAHFASVLDPDLMEEKIGQTMSKYTGEFGYGFRGTRYGQMAITLDPTGILNDLSNPDQKKLRVRPSSALGKNGVEY